MSESINKSYRELFLKDTPVGMMFVMSKESPQISECIHVVEIAALDDLKTENEYLNEHAIEAKKVIRQLEHQIEKLTAALKVAEDALEEIKISNPASNHDWIITQEALAEIKKIKGR